MDHGDREWNVRKRCDSSADGHRKDREAAAEFASTVKGCRMYQGRILVVDDEVYILHILDFILGAENYDVITATNGEQAIERVREENPDLVVLDIMMPKMDGYETCRLIKSDPATKLIPVILLTAKGREVDQKLGKEVGASDYITKPFSPSKLIERVQAILATAKR
jgi:two-component system, OmpR family, alkaline phosphatase synthesis response regulator PhoP